MITIPQLKEYSHILMRDIDAIKRVIGVIDVDKITAELNTIKSADNLLLYVVIPEAMTDFSNREAVKDYNTFHFLIMEKSDATMGKEERNEVMTRTQAAAIAIKKHIINTANGQGEWSCGSWLREIFNEGDLSIKPLYHTAQLHGWIMSISIRDFS